MVRLGFIVEGATEKIILTHSDFFAHLDALGIAYVSDVIDAEGNGNLLPHNILPFTKILEDKGATHIFIFTDLDKDQCITNTKARIAPLPNHVVVVSVQAIEAWFLADSVAMGRYFEDDTFTYAQPEAVAEPFDEIKALRKAKTERGLTDKKILANSLVRKYNFSILRAAAHSACASARYFLQKIEEVAGANP